MQTLKIELKGTGRLFSDFKHRFSSLKNLFQNNDCAHGLYMVASGLQLGLDFLAKLEQNNGKSAALMICITFERKIEN